MVASQFIILGVLILFSAFFSGIETALMSLNMVKVNTLVKQKKKGSQALYRIKQNPRKLIITILIGNNLVNIGAAAYATVVFTGIFGNSGVGIATGIMTFFVLVFGEITPKTFATQNTERISLIVARPIEILSFVLTPFILIFSFIANVMSMVLGSKPEKELTEDELKMIVTMGAEQGLLNKKAAAIMKKVLEFEGTQVHEVMTPKAEIKMIDSDKNLKDVIEDIIKTRHSRYPVYNADKDNILGILDVDDIIVKTNNLNFPVKNMVRKVLFVPETKEIDELLIEFEGKREQIAMVVNEYGDVIGLVTIEDILEEIVGDIFDKTDRGSIHIKKIDKRHIRVDAKATIEAINKELHLGIQSDKFNTISGFIQHKLKRIPKKGEKIKLQKAIIEVEKATDKGIQELKIIKL